MSILGVGNDIVAVDRIASMLDRYGQQFLGRCFLPDEISYINSRGKGRAASAAARWAAKEAFLKALGQNVQTIPYGQVEVRRDANGAVTLQLHGRALRAAEQLGVQKAHLALSHEKEFALATVVLESAG